MTKSCERKGVKNVLSFSQKLSLSLPDILIVFPSGPSNYVYSYFYAFEMRYGINNLKIDSASIKLTTMKKLTILR